MAKGERCRLALALDRDLRGHQAAGSRDGVVIDLTGGIVYA